MTTRPLVPIGLALIVIALLAAAVMVVVGIWTADSRWTGTAFAVGIPVALLGAISIGAHYYLSGYGVLDDEKRPF